MKRKRWSSDEKTGIVMEWMTTRTGTAELCPVPGRGGGGARAFTDYNRRKIHTSLGYLMQDEFARKWKRGGINERSDHTKNHARIGPKDKGPVQTTEV